MRADAELSPGGRVRGTVRPVEPGRRAQGASVTAELRLDLEKVDAVRSVAIVALAVAPVTASVRPLLNAMLPPL